MYKSITNSQNATRLLHFDFTPTRYVKDNNAQALKFIDTTDNQIKFAWSVFANKEKTSYVGYSPSGTVHAFKPEQIIDWFPYNGEPIEDIFTIGFDAKGNLLLNIVPILTEEEADKLLTFFYPHLNGTLSVGSVVGKDSMSNLVEGDCWIRQTNGYNFAVINLLTRKTEFINRHFLGKYYHIGEKIDKYILKQENQKLCLTPK